MHSQTYSLCSINRFTQEIKTNLAFKYLCLNFSLFSRFIRKKKDGEKLQSERLAEDGHLL